MEEKTGTGGVTNTADTDQNRMSVLYLITVNFLKFLTEVSLTKMGLQTV